MEKAGTKSDEAVYAGQERRAALFGELHLKLLEQYAPPSIVVNEQHDIVHLSEKAGHYLRFAAGEPSSNLFRVINPALQLELRTALFRASQGEELTVTTSSRTVHLDGASEVVCLQVRRVQNKAGEKFYLVLFEPQPEAPAPPGGPAEQSDLTRSLDAEIQHLKGQLEATVEQYEAGSEELKASNEQLQAMNEELRSTTEELETSKEELQSVNEEVSTVNNELKISVEDLSRTNADLNNLIASTDIGTLFLDRELHVQRFTPSAQKIFNLLPADIGRPLSDITHRLRYEGLSEDARQALGEVRAVEREVRVGQDNWFLVRLLPYRTREDRIDGVVITFVDITARKHAELELASQLHKFDTVMTAASDFIYHFDLEGRFTYANEALLGLWQKSFAEVIGKNFHELEYPPQLAARLQHQIHEVIETRRPLKDETPYTSASGERQYEYIFSPLFADDGSVEAVAGVTRDITDRKKAEQALAESEERFRRFAENSSDVFWIIDTRTRELDYLNPAYERIWGETREIIMREKDRWIDLVHPDDREEARRLMPRLIAGEVSTIQYRIVRPSDGSIRWIRDTGFPIRDETGSIYRAAGVAQDVTEDKARAEELRHSEERFRLLVEGAKGYAMFLLDPENKIVYWNFGAEKVFGWKAEEAIGQSGEIVFTPEDRAIEREEKEMDIAMRKGSANDQRWHMRKDGSRIWVDGIMHRLDDEKGNLRGFAKVARDATEERKHAEELREAHLELETRVLERTAQLTTANRQLKSEIARRGELEREVQMASEREKRRIGQDLHDGLCQELAASAFFLQSAAQKIEKQNPAAAATLSEAATIVNDNVGLARDLARGLHPVELGATGLTNALRELAFRTSQKPVQCLFECPKPIRVRDEAVALNLYRIAQEAVTNARKNGKAKKIVIRLARQRARLVLTVTDDGVGFAPAKATKGMGIHIMQYRANTIGGTLTVEARADHGTMVTCILGRG